MRASRDGNRLVAREVSLLRGDSEYQSLCARDAVNPGYMNLGKTIFRLAPKRTVRR